MAIRPVFGKTMLAVLVAATVAGCSVTPTRLTDQEVMANTVENNDLLAADYAPVTQPIDLNEAFARIIKHNRDAV